MADRSRDSSAGASEGSRVDMFIEIYMFMKQLSEKYGKTYDEMDQIWHEGAIAHQLLRSDSRVRSLPPPASHPPHFYSSSQMQAAAWERLENDLSTLREGVPQRVPGSKPKKQRNPRLTDWQQEVMRTLIKENDSDGGIVHEAARKGIKVSRQQVEYMRRGRTYSERKSSMHEQHSNDKQCALSGSYQFVSQPPAPSVPPNAKT